MMWPGSDSSDAWQRCEIESTGGTGAKPVAVRWSTNDDDDDGYDDGEIVRDTFLFADVAAALRFTGHSRIGISGIVVTVMLDGVEVTE